MNTKNAPSVPRNNSTGSETNSIYENNDSTSSKRREKYARRKSAPMVLNTSNNSGKSARHRGRSNSFKISKLKIQSLKINATQNATQNSKQNSKQNATQNATQNAPKNTSNQKNTKSQNSQNNNQNSPKNSKNTKSSSDTPSSSISGIKSQAASIQNEPTDSGQQFQTSNNPMFSQQFQSSRQPPRFQNRSPKYQTNGYKNRYGYPKISVFPKTPTKTSQFHDRSSSGNIHNFSIPTHQDLPWRAFEKELTNGEILPMECFFGWSSWKNPESNCLTCSLNLELIRPNFHKNKNLAKLNCQRFDNDVVFQQHTHELQHNSNQNYNSHQNNYQSSPIHHQNIHPNFMNPSPIHHQNPSPQQNTHQIDNPSLTDVGKLFIGALPHDFQDQDLGIHFKRWGNVIDHPVIMQKESERDGRKRSRGFGFVRYEFPLVAMWVLKEFCDERSKLEHIEDCGLVLIESLEIRNDKHEIDITVKAFYENFTKQDKLENLRRSIRDYRERTHRYDEKPELICSECYKIATSLPKEKAERFFVFDHKVKKDKLIVVKPCAPEKSKIELGSLLWKNCEELDWKVKDGVNDHVDENGESDQNARVYRIYVLVEGKIDVDCEAETRNMNRYSNNFKQFADVESFENGNFAETKNFSENENPQFSETGFRFPETGQFSSGDVYRRIMQQVFHLFRFYGVIYEMKFVGKSDTEVLLELCYKSEFSAKLVLYLGMSNPTKVYRIPSARAGL